MFSRQTVSKDPVSVIPTVFGVTVLLGWFSYPVAINCTTPPPVLDSTAWHVRETITLTPSNPELLLIPWVAEAYGTLTVDNPNLTDSLLLGESIVNISILVKGFTGEDSELAPSWYVREPFKTEMGIPYNEFRELDPELFVGYTSAEDKSTHVSINNKPLIDLSVTLSSIWDFLIAIDRETTISFTEFKDKYIADIAQKYASPDVKELEKIIPWGKFDDQFSIDFSYPYLSPAWKDLEKIIPWGAFALEIDKSLSFLYASPSVKDVFKTIFTGPNWFPRWCVPQYSPTDGDVLFNFLTAVNFPYDQYFPQLQFPLNEIDVVQQAPQLERKIALANREQFSYVSGFPFGRKPLNTYTPEQILFRGSSSMTLNARAGHLEYPVYMKNSIDDYSEICFDGYRTGPQDKYDYKPIYVKVIEPNIRSYYFVMNVVNLKRVSDDEIIPITSMTISTDMDSWCWTISANLRRSVDLDLVRPTAGAPIEVEASINGNIWRFLIENYGDTRSFGRNEYTISGRSPSSALAEPYAAPESFLEPSLRQAAALADDALVSTGFSAIWGLTDWLVPGNVFSVINKTPIQQLLQIASAAGGVVHSDPSATTISLLPWYAVMPWEWGGATIDAVLPVFSSKRTQYLANPQYSGVYTSGTTQGVMCFVKRTGTDGSDQPQMVTDPLVTATEAGLQLGKKILADSGRRAIETIDVPFLDNPGLLTPGMLIDVIDGTETWRGQVISVSLSANRPTVTQSLSILRYHGD